MADRRGTAQELPVQLSTLFRATILGDKDSRGRDAGPRGRKSKHPARHITRKKAAGSGRQRQYMEADLHLQTRPLVPGGSNRVQRSSSVGLSARQWGCTVDETLQ